MLKTHFGNDKKKPVTEGSPACLRDDGWPSKEWKREFWGSAPGWKLRVTIPSTDSKTKCLNARGKPGHNNKRACWNYVQFHQGIRVQDLKKGKKLAQALSRHFLYVRPLSNAKWRSGWAQNWAANRAFSLKTGIRGTKIPKEQKRAKRKPLPAICAARRRRKMKREAAVCARKLGFLA